MCVLKLYFWNVFRRLDNFHEWSVKNLPTVLKAWLEFNARFLHFHLHQQQLRFHKVAVLLQDGRAREQVSSEKTPPCPRSDHGFQKSGLVRPDKCRWSWTGLSANLRPACGAARTWEKPPSWKTPGQSLEPLGWGGCAAATGFYRCWGETRTQVAT